MPGTDLGWCACRTKQYFLLPNLIDAPQQRLLFKSHVAVIASVGNPDSQGIRPWVVFDEGALAIHYTQMSLSVNTFHENYADGGENGSISHWSCSNNPFHE